MCDRRCQRSLALLMGACLLAGCGPEGAGSIKVDRTDLAVRNFKTFEDAKRPKSARDASKPARPKSRAGSDYR